MLSARANWMSPLTIRAQAQQSRPSTLARFVTLVRTFVFSTYVRTYSKRIKVGRLTGAAEASGARGSVRFHSTSDIDARCREILEGHPAETRAHHSFGNFCDEVPRDVYQRLRHAEFSNFQTFKVRAPRRIFAGGSLREPQKVESLKNLQV